MTSMDDWRQSLDPGIRQIVMILSGNGVETYESCAGSGPHGQGWPRGHSAHSYPEPTVAFHGNFAAGLHALEVAINHGLPVSELRRVWSIQNGEPVGPTWHMTFDLSPRNLVGWLAKNCRPYSLRGPRTFRRTK
jgi:hypothetical protein